MVKIPIKISATDKKEHSNITNYAIKSMSHFGNNLENVLEAILSLKERVIKLQGIKDDIELIKTTIHLMQLICTGGPVSQLLNEFAYVACQLMYD